MKSFDSLCTQTETRRRKLNYKSHLRSLGSETGLNCMRVGREEGYLVPFVDPSQDCVVLAPRRLVQKGVLRPNGQDLYPFSPLSPESPEAYRRGPSPTRDDQEKRKRLPGPRPRK